MAKKSIDESTARILVGVMQTLQGLTLALERKKSLDPAEFAYCLESLIGRLAPDALESLPLAMMLQFLQPDTPPRPVLRLIHGVKKT